MRLLLSLYLLLTVSAVAQKAPIVTSSSEWAVVTITKTDTVAKPGSALASAKTKSERGATTKTKAKPTSTTASVAESADVAVAEKAIKPARPVADKPVATTTVAKPRTTSRSFLETFADNRNGWLTGRRNGFELELADDNSYYIRSTKPIDGKSLPRPGRSYIKLSDNLNLNKADTFTVSVEMVTPPGIAPDGGLLIGVKDTSNYCQFRLLDKNKVALYTRIDGVSQPNYMTGKPTPAKVAIDAKRNTLTIRRTGQELHFFINGKEVEDSPHPYRPFKGNGVGFISYANAVKFQYLTVQLGK